MIGWEYPPNYSGGLGIACQGIVENLVEQGEEIILVLPSVMTPKSVCENIFHSPTGKPYRVIYVRSKLRPYAGKDGVEYKGDVIEDVKTYARKVFNAVSEEDFDLIHIHDWLTVPAGLRIKEETGKPMVMHVHSTEYDRTAGGDGNKEVEEIEKKGYLAADKIIAVSGYTKKVLVEKYQVPDEKVEVVHNGNNYLPHSRQVSVDFLKNCPVVIFVGRLTIQKGPVYFIEMAKQVFEKRPETVFVFAGDGDMTKQLMMTSAFSGLSGTVLFAGFLKDEARDRLYQRADVFVMPSVSEPFGIVALEAAVAGVPVVVSKTSGVAEVLPSSIRLDFWDTDLMAKSILALIEKGDYRRELGEKIRSEAGAITWEKSAIKIRENYHQLLEVDRG